METIIYDIYLEYGEVDLWRLVKKVGNKYTAFREIILFSDYLNSTEFEDLGLDEHFKKKIFEALENCHYVQKDAADVLKITPRRLHWYVQKFNITEAMRPRS